MIHPGHPAAGFLVRSLVVAGSATLLATTGTPAGGQDEGYRQEQREDLRLRQKRLQGTSYSCGVRVRSLTPALPERRTPQSLNTWRTSGVGVGGGWNNTARTRRRTADQRMPSRMRNGVPLGSNPKSRPRRPPTTTAKYSGPCTWSATLRSALATRSTRSPA